MRKILNWLKLYFIPHEENGHKPCFLKAKTLFSLFSFVVVIELIFVLVFFQIIPSGNFFGSLLMTDVLVDLTNENREESGLKNLKQNSLLEAAAQLKAEDMAVKGYFAHTSPEGVDPWYWFDLVGYDFVYAGENLAVNFIDPYDINKAWMESPKHKKNIINDKFNEIGIGTAKGEYNGRESIFVVQLFGSPRNVSKNIAMNSVENKEDDKTIEIETIKTETLETDKEVIEEVKEDERFFVEENMIETTKDDILGEENIVDSVLLMKTDNQEKKKDLKAGEYKIESESFIYLNRMDDVNNDEKEENNIVVYSTFVNKLISSPKKIIYFIFIFLSIILMVSLILKIFVKIKTQFPVLAIDGLLVFTVILLALTFNNYAFNLLGQI